MVHQVGVALAAGAAIVAQFDAEQFQSAYAHWPEAGGVFLSSRAATWDSAHYLVLSQRGYVAGSPSCAFFPLWPLIIRLASFLAGHRPLVASFVLTTAFSLLAFKFLHALVERSSGGGVAGDVLVLMLASPGALFFCFPYTESLYLLLVMLFFHGLDRQEDLVAGITALLLPLTRAVGVFVLFPLAWHLYERRRPWRHWLLLLGPVVGYALYFALMFVWTGNAFEGFDAQKSYPYSPSIANMFNLHGLWNAFSEAHSLDGMMDSALDRGLFLLFLALLPLVYRLNRTWFWYTLPAGLVPGLTSYFMSYRRYLMVCFPVFVVMAQLLAKTKRRWVFWYYVVVLAALQVWAVTRFVNFRWAG